MNLVRPDKEVSTREETLRADHDQLEALTKQVSELVRQGQPGEIAEAISMLQSRVLTHIDSEERELFERYAIYAPLDAAQLVAEHAEIRRALAALDVSVDLHTVRANALDVLLGSLRAHAERENAGLYRWSTALPAR